MNDFVRIFDELGDTSALKPVRVVLFEGIFPPQPPQRAAHAVAPLTQGG